jgi:hypothetical protein
MTQQIHTKLNYHQVERVGQKLAERDGYDNKSGR